MKQVCLLFLLGCLLIAEGICPAAATRHFRDVMSRGRASSHNIFHRRLNNWSSDHNNWNDKLYPYWEEGDPRWKDCWKGGRVVANLTSDSPALIGSNVTFTVTLKFPRCQREDNDSNIVYDRNCVNGQYYQKTGGSSAMVSINTTNITLGQQIMEVSIYRRSRASYVPVTTVNVVYVLTDKIPFHVKISQKNDRNASDHIFIKDQPITFEVQIHDPSHYLNDSVITYHWNFGDGSGSFVSNNSVFMHTYTLLGNFSLNLSVQAIIPTTCGPITPTPPLTTLPAVTTQLPRNVTTPASDSLAELPTEEAPDKECHITRYGPYKGSLFVVEGILGVNIIQMTSVQVASTQAESSVVDFVVTCQGSLPTDACTIIADPTCQVPQSEACDLVDIEDECLLTISRAFNGSGTYCVNITLADEASLALTSTLVSINGAAGSFSRTAEGVLIACGFLVIVAVVLTLFLYKRYKQYKPIERKAGEAVNSERLSVYFNNVKAVLFPANNERHPLLNNKPGIV
ncbi:transmembrane glycoprotein NMB isoform X7 [Hemicordylus capensis]|uniref:transmembrane glycoprotein NMB isoform X7 n=1 Tax=Hemicordylus capensis TaxID=884348 RepID=UPI002303318B|nr:transmembrane glycoprotein NMB isoform X7 [Hemicordylus capensis]